MGNTEKFSGNYTATEIETITKKAVTIAGFKTSDQDIYKTFASNERHIYTRSKRQTAEIYTVYQKEKRKIALFNPTSDTEYASFSQNTEDRLTSLGAALGQFKDSNNKLTADELIIPIARQGGITHWSVLHFKKNENGIFSCVLYDPKTNNNLHNKGNKYLETKIKELFNLYIIPVFLDQIPKDNVNIQNPLENLSGLYSVENIFNLILDQQLSANNNSKIKSRENIINFKNKHQAVHDLDPKEATEAHIELLKTTETLDSFFAKIRTDEIKAREKQSQLAIKQQDLEPRSDESSTSPSSARSSSSLDSRSSVSLTLNSSHVTLTEITDPEINLDTPLANSPKTKDISTKIPPLTLPPLLAQQHIVRPLIGDSPRPQQPLTNPDNASFTDAQNNQEKTAYDFIKDIQKRIIETKNWSTKLGGNAVFYYKTQNNKIDLNSFKWADVPDGVKSILNAIRKARTLIKQNEGKYTPQQINEIYSDTFCEIKRIAAERLAYPRFSFWFFKVRSDTTTQFYEYIVNQCKSESIFPTSQDKQLIQFNT